MSLCYGTTAPLCGCILITNNRQNRNSPNKQADFAVSLPQIAPVAKEQKSWHTQWLAHNKSLAWCKNKTSQIVLLCAFCNLDTGHCQNVCEFQVMTSLSSLSENHEGSACCNDQGCVRVQPEMYW